MGLKAYFIALLVCWPVMSFAASVTEGEVIYMEGTDKEGQRIPAVMDDLTSYSPLACVNCHRESGFGSSESGQTFPPVSWRFLGKNQPEEDTSRFYHIQNKRKAYTPDSFYRLLVSGINSNGDVVDGLMPKYALSKQQSDALIAYLKTISTEDDPGVNGEEIRIATIVDKRVPESERAQHIAFLQGLFEMKNGLSRGELKRKANSPVQKIPQYESFRFWKLVVWELSEDPSSWSQELSNYYSQNSVFTVMRPIIKDGYETIARFCTDEKIPCFFPSGENLPEGDFYNFVFRNRQKQSVDYLNKKRREYKVPLLYIDAGSNIEKLDDSMDEIPYVAELDSMTLQRQYEQYCSSESMLLVNSSTDQIADLEQLRCSKQPRLKLTAMSNELTGYQDIVGYLNTHKDTQICWATDYNKVLKRNLRKIRVNAMVQRFNIENPDYEELAKTLLNYGLLTDSLHKMAGNFTRVYMMEIIEHMLNSFPNYTYFTSITGAPYQRYIVGPIDEYCVAGEKI